MRLWLSRTGEVSLREQLITQVVLAILCKELLPGQRLPKVDTNLILSYARAASR